MNNLLKFASVISKIGGIYFQLIHFAIEDDSEWSTDYIIDAALKPALAELNDLKGS